jgi:hypothetical protein
MTVASPRTVFRWLLIPFACVAAWYVALFVGIFLLSVAESFCPADEMVSGMCIAPWYRTVEAAIFCFSTALSAVLVVLAAFVVAPHEKATVAWIAFAVGVVVAFYFAIMTSAWPLFASALLAGLITVSVLDGSHLAVAKQYVRYQRAREPSA